MGYLEGQVVGIDKIKQRPGPLVQHVGIEASGLQQRDPPLPPGSFGPQGRKFSLEFGNPPVDILPRPQSIRTCIGIGPEIPDQKGC